MLILGLDFTSAPSRSKPITCAHCTLRSDTSTLTLDQLDPLPTFPAFEAALARPGPFIASIDFPFSQPRTFIEAIAGPITWPEFVAKIAATSKADFEAAIVRYRDGHPTGSKHPLRIVDRLAESCSPLMLSGVPVGKMFFEGAPRILRSGASIMPGRPLNSDRLIVEAYPGVAVRTLMGRKLSYKSDDRVKQTPEKEAARRAIVAALRAPHTSSPYALTVRLADAQAADLIADPTGDTLDAVICALQAAWAYTQRDHNYGIPPTADPLEGWIPDPGLIPGSRPQLRGAPMPTFHLTIRLNLPHDLASPIFDALNPLVKESGLTFRDGVPGLIEGRALTPDRLALLLDHLATLSTTSDTAATAVTVGLLDDLWVHITRERDTQS